MGHPIFLDQTEIGEQSIMALATTLTSLTYVESLSLWFNQTKLEDPSVSSLCSSLKSFAKNLEQLSLNFD